MKKILCVCMALFMSICGSSCIYALLRVDDYPGYPEILYNSDWTCCTYNNVEYGVHDSGLGLQYGDSVRLIRLYGSAEIVAKYAMNTTYRPVYVSTQDLEQNILWEHSGYIFAVKQGFVLPKIEEAPLTRIFSQAKSSGNEITVVQDQGGAVYLTDFIETAPSLSKAEVFSYFDEQVDAYFSFYCDLKEYEYFVWDISIIVWLDRQCYCSFRWYDRPDLGYFPSGYYKIKPEYQDAFRNAIETLKS